MNKSDLVDAIADAAGLSKADAGRALDATLDAVTGEQVWSERSKNQAIGCYAGPGYIGKQVADEKIVKHVPRTPQEYVSGFC